MRTFLRRPAVAEFIRGAVWVCLYAVALGTFVYVAVVTGGPRP